MVRVTAVVLLAPGTERVRDGIVLVGEQREPERVLLVERQLLLRPVGADAHDVQPDR